MDTNVSYEQCLHIAEQCGLQADDVLHAMDLEQQNPQEPDMHFQIQEITGDHCFDPSSADEMDSDIE